MKPHPSLWLPVVTIALLVMVFVLSHPYGGIRHDGILYLGEALVQVDPARMADDLFFLYGSQASFTAVPHIYAEVIRLLGISQASRSLLVISLALYFLSALWVLSRTVSREVFVWAATAIFVASPVYGGHRVFAYGETFFTSRSLAEPLVLFALGFVLRGRPLVGVVLAVMALFLHPLMALPAVLFCWVWLAAENRRWWWALSLGVLPLMLAFAGVAPFADLFRSYDHEWMSVVQDANVFVFPSNWLAQDWSTVAFDAILLAWVQNRYRHSHGVTAQVARAALITGLVGLIGAVIGADILQNVLLTGLQLWRAHWLMHWVAMGLAVQLAWDLWKADGNHHRTASLAIIGAILSMTTFGPALLISLAAVLVRFRHRLPIGRTTVVATALLCAALTVVLLVRQVSALTAFYTVIGGSQAVQIARLMSVTLVIVTLVAIGSRLSSRVPALVLASTFLVIGVAVFGWDQREAWARYQEDYTDTHPVLWADAVAAGDRVYWYREIRAPWLMMRHANYYSPNQASGVLFNRKTAMELESRAHVAGLLELQETICQTLNMLNKKATACEPELEVISDVCTRADHLAFVVLQSRLGVAPAGVLRTGFVEHDFEKTFYLYRCSDLAAH